MKKKKPNNMKKNWNKDRPRRLEEMEDNEKIKLVYMWIKQGVLSYKEFSYLIKTGVLTKPQLIEE